MPLQEKGRAQQQHGKEPSQAVWTPSCRRCNCSSCHSCSQSPGHREPPSPPVLLHQSQTQEKGPLTCFITLSDPTRFCLVPGFSIGFGWGKKVQLQVYPTFCFSRHRVAQQRVSCDFAFVWETMSGTVFKKCFCLFSGEYPFVDKTLSFAQSFINIFVVIAIFQ